MRLAPVSRLLRTPMGMFVISTTASLMLGAISSASAAITPSDVTTSFEFPDTDGFTLGTSPNSVSFSEDGEAKTLGRLPLYRTDFFSYMVANQDTATVSFETPAESVELFANQETSDVNGLIEAFDTNGNTLDSINVTSTTSGAFQRVALEANSLGAPIGRLTVANNSPSTDPDYLVVDDFSFRAVPEPTSAAILALGTVGLLYRRQRSV